ncbi:MAG: 30S ribosomal protein S12 methylthiotransferase RimO, partial [Patescibacteria group bacterium]|nr:30S ribosomal protein S12 methylthiotransferase RimO [Patescibacteria group bacterium]
GCPKNLVDSECMGGDLNRAGFRMAASPDGADFVVINTCGFIADACEESYAVIEEMLELRRRGKVGGVIVAGCLAERKREELLAQYPEIDRLVGVFARDELVATARQMVARQSGPQAVFRAPPACPADEAKRLRLTPRHVAYLKIAEGCNRLCSFCTIPSIRGPYTSKPLDQVVREAEQLAADGARELVLIAQDTSFYGRDLQDRPQLAELLQRLNQIDGLRWIRLMYLYPTHVGDELIRAINASERVVPYLDLPLQHISDPVLQRMRRRVSRADTESLLDRLRAEIDRLILRTTFIVGFPGETEEQFAELREFVGARRFERMGVFTYRDEPDTAAEQLDGKVPEDVMVRRQGELMALQQGIAFDWCDRQVGQTVDVLIDRCIPGEKRAFVGRTYADAPEVDGVVYVTGTGLAPGRIAPCEIVARKEYDLIAAYDAT